VGEKKGVGRGGGEVIREEIKKSKRDGQEMGTRSSRGRINYLKKIFERETQGGGKGGKT